MQSPLPKPQVLLVDEVKRTLKLAHAFLTNDYDVVACDTVQEALERLEREGYHVLVASHHLEAIDVFALAERARQVQPHLSCLVISNTTPPHDPSMIRPNIRAIKAPYHPANLIALVDRLIIEGEKAAEELYDSRPPGS